MYKETCLVFLLIFLEFDITCGQVDFGIWNILLQNKKWISTLLLSNRLLAFTLQPVTPTKRKLRTEIKYFTYVFYIYEKVDLKITTTRSAT